MNKDQPTYETLFQFVENLAKNIGDPQPNIKEPFFQGYLQCHNQIQDEARRILGIIDHSLSRSSST